MESEKFDMELLQTLEEEAWIATAEALSCTGKCYFQFQLVK